MTPRSRRGVWALFLCGLAAVAALWWRGVPGSDPPIGVVVVTLDTVRADRLSMYGFANVSLPHLERLAREGVVFDQAMSVAPLTLPAHTSLFTGLLPPNHGVRDNADSALAGDQTTLAETLRARGFRTGAFVGSIVLDPSRGLKQGFERYDAVPPSGRAMTDPRQRRADDVIAGAVAWIDTVADSSFFLWAHLYDPHRPYDPPEPYRTTYAHNLYVGEIAFADSQIGRLMQALDARQLLNRTLIVVVGDHGEALGDHGERDHGIFVYEEVIRVPLIVRAPALPPSRVGEVVRLTDVMPTVLDLLDVPSPPGDGVSLVDLMTGRRRDLNLEAYAESLYPERFGWSPLRSLRDARFKLIDAPRPELYDLHDDSVEEENIYDERRALAEQMTARLAAAAKGRRSTSSRGPGIGPDVRAQLASLGYLGSASAPHSPGRAHRPDPKDCIGGSAGAPRPPTVDPACSPWLSADDIDTLAPARAEP